MLGQMESTAVILLQSWDRQTDILSRLADRVEPGDLALTPAEGESDIAEHLCHIHGTRRFWLSKASPEHLQGKNLLFTQIGEDDWECVRDLDVIRAELAKSARAVGDATRAHLESGVNVGQYEHPVFFLQHMLWHEGWHTGLIMLALRRNGKEPPEAWEDPNIWQLWRGSEAPD